MASAHHEPKTNSYSYIATCVACVNEESRPLVVCFRCAAVPSTAPTRLPAPVIFTMSYWGQMACWGGCVWAPNGKYKGLGCLRPQTSVNSMHILAAKHNVPASAVSRLVRFRSSPRGLVGFLFGFLGGTVGSLCERVCVC